MAIDLLRPGYEWLDLLFDYFRAWFKPFELVNRNSGALGQQFASLDEDRVIIEACLFEAFFDHGKISGIRSQTRNEGLRGLLFFTLRPADFHLGCCRQ